MLDLQETIDPHDREIMMILIKYTMNEIRKRSVSEVPVKKVCIIRIDLAIDLGVGKETDGIEATIEVVIEAVTKVMTEITIKAPTIGIMRKVVIEAMIGAVIKVVKGAMKEVGTKVADQIVEKEAQDKGKKRMVRIKRVGITQRPNASRMTTVGILKKKRHLLTIQTQIRNRNLHR